MLFISYAREDWQAAAKLANELEAEGIECVIDPELAEGDPFWREAIMRQFPQCELMVGLVSAHADCSPWVEQEQRAFPGPKLWIAVDPAVPRPQPRSGGRAEPIPPDRAMPAIRDALPPRLRRQRARKRERPHRLIRREERLLHIQQQQSRLDAFLRSRDRAAPAIDVEGDIARSRNSSIEFRRCVDGPARQATFIGTTPVTNAQYGAFIDETGYAEPPTWRRAEFRAADAPVTGINWFEACAFAAWIGGSLLNEDEWLSAARGRDPRRRFATASGTIDPTLACFGRTFGASVPVAATAYRPNPEGYHGLCGNIWDWCASAWGPYRAIRGGGCMDAASFCTIESRYRHAPIDRDCCVGFRVKVTLDGIV